MKTISSRLFGVLQVDRLVGRRAIDLLVEQIEQAVLRFEDLALIGQRQAGIEIRVIPEQVLDVLVVEAVVRENLRVGREAGERPGLLPFRRP